MDAIAILSALAEPTRLKALRMAGKSTAFAN
jgi:DNA-binding transcriptional ArsR family regulator